MSTETHLTQADILAATKSLLYFIGKAEMAAIRDSMRGEEGYFFYEKMLQLAELIRTMPHTYQQDGLGENAIAYLHYFKGNMDWWITEKDSEPDQNQAFGLADLGYGAELGYVSLIEITSAGVELDLYWTPKTLKEIREKRN